MAEQPGPISREEFTHAVRESSNADMEHTDHHPHHGYTPAAFRHYIRQRALIGALEKMSFRSALDVGCAEGYFMNVIAERFGAEVWGVDLSTTAAAKGHARHGLPVAAADATRLPFPDGSFELVLSTEVIEHVLEPELMVAEMRRVSRGQVLVTTPVSQSADEHAPDFALEAEGHINNFDPATVRRLFGEQAQLGSFRCNATLAAIVAVGRHLPAGPRDAFYNLDHAVSQRLGAPDHRFKPLRNRDWLITLPGLGEGAGGPRFVCPACHGELREREQALSCEGCGASYQVREGVPDFFEGRPAG